MTRVAIVGGGVIGMASAFSLLDVADEITVLDAGTVGGGASAGNAGWVTPSLAMPLAAPGMVRTGLRSAFDPRGALVIRPALDTEWLRWLWRFTRSATPHVFERGVESLLGMTTRSLDELDRMGHAGVRFEEHRAGLLAVARSRGGLHWFDQAFDVLRRKGFTGSLEPMDAAGAHDLEPALGDAVGAAVYTSIDRHVAPESLVAGLAAYARARGVEIREHAAVRRLTRAGSRWALAGEDGELDRADIVVLASALGTPALVRPFGLRLPMVGAKGYSVTVAPPDPAPRLPLYLCEPKIGVSPFAAGMRLAGFFELGARDGTPSIARARQLVEETAPYLRSIGDAVPAEGPSGWAGFRPATPDSLPLIGPVPEAPGLIVATGHGMLGFTLGPATGVAVAALVRGERPAWIVPFDPARLAR
jgi:D-amino-acid dehydrogenase